MFGKMTKIDTCSSQVNSVNFNKNTKRVGPSQLYLFGGPSRLAQALELSIWNCCFSIDLSLAPPSFPLRVLLASFTSSQRPVLLRRWWVCSRMGDRACSLKSAILFRQRIWARPDFKPTVGAGDFEAVRSVLGPSPNLLWTRTPMVVTTHHHCNTVRFLFYIFLFYIFLFSVF